MSCGKLKYIRAQAESALRGEQDPKSVLRVIKMNCDHALAAHSPKGADTQPKRSEGHSKNDGENFASPDQTKDPMAERRRAAGICVAEARIVNDVVRSNAAFLRREGRNKWDSQTYAITRTRRDALMRVARQIMGKTK